MTLGRSRGRRIHAAIGAAAAWVGLVLQYAILVRGSELGPVGATIRFFSYFTILTNVLVACTFTAIVLERRDHEGFFTRMSVQSGIALAIALVGVAYSLLLRRIWDPQGWQRVADHLLHDAVPVLFVAFWVMWVPKAELRPAMVWRWALYPVTYFAYAILQARFTNWFPYPFIDVPSLGYAAVIRNALVILALFVAAGLVMVVAGRRFSRRVARPSAA